MKPNTPFPGKNIGSKLVKSYMNAFCIDEDDQCDIDGIFYISSILPYLVYRDLGEYEETSEFKIRPWREKMIISGSMNSMNYKTTITDIHLIIETSIYHLRNEMTSELLNDAIIDMIVNWMDTVSTVSSYDHIVVTLLHGEEERACSSEEVKIAYERSNSEKKKIYKCSSFQDDLEKLHSYLTFDVRREYPKNFEWLFMFKMSNDDTKIEKMKTFQQSTNHDRKSLPGPSSYSQLMEYTEHQLEKPWHYKNKHLFEQPEKELEYRFIQYDCARFTFEVPRL